MRIALPALDKPVAAGLVAGACVFLAAAVLLLQASHWLAVSRDRADLAALAQRVLARSESVAAEVRSALDALGDLEPGSYCSQSALKRFSDVLLGAHYLRAVGGLSPEGRACSSAGAFAETAALPQPVWTHSGFSAYLAIGRALGLPENSAAIFRGRAFAAVDPAVLVDVMPPPGVHVALLDIASGRAIAATRGADLPAMAAARSSDAPRETASAVFVARRHARAPVAAVASGEHVAPLERWRAESLVWIALAGFFGLLGGFAATAFARHRLSPEADLRRALARGELAVFYQPIVELATGRCAGAEALARWRRPDGTLMRPDLFVPLAEETGLVLALTDRVLENVLADLGELLRSEPICVSINLSARDVVSTRVLDLAERALRAAGVPARRIAFEATERGFVDTGSAAQALRRYRAAGHRILIDDFGTGYSSLAQLQNLEVDAIKIDKSFVDVIGTGAAARSVVPHIVRMAKTLGLELVAEGVETEEQAAYLRERGVEYGQGWLFGKPMPAEELRRYLAATAKV